MRNGIISYADTNMRALCAAPVADWREISIGRFTDQIPPGRDFVVPIDSFEAPIAGQWSGRRGHDDLETWRGGFMPG
jgi:hypothetical protein